MTPQQKATRQAYQEGTNTPKPGQDHSPGTFTLFQCPRCTVCLGRTSPPHTPNPKGMWGKIVERSTPEADWCPLVVVPFEGDLNCNLGSKGQIDSLKAVGAYGQPPPPLSRASVAVGKALYEK